MVPLKLVSIDNNQTSELFPRKGFDPEALARTLRERQIHISYTEESWAEALGSSDSAAAYERLRRIAEFEQVAGADYFSVGAGLRAIIDHELEFTPELPSSKFPRYSRELQQHWFSMLRESPERFEEWRREELEQAKQWANKEGRLAKDRTDSVRGQPYEQFAARFQERVDAERLEAAHKQIQRHLANSTSGQEFVEEQIRKIPQELATNWVLEMLVEDDALRARVAREPERCPSLVALAGGYSVNRCAATMGVIASWPRLGWLAPAKNDYADARILAEAAYAHVLVSRDKVLCCRAKLLNELGLFHPEVMTWTELLARPV